MLGAPEGAKDTPGCARGGLNHCGNQSKAGCIRQHLLTSSTFKYLLDSGLPAERDA